MVEGEGVLESSLRRSPLPARRLRRRSPRGPAPLAARARRPSRLLVIESAGYVRTPKRYRNEHGQLTEMAPFSERDIRRPGAPRHPRRDRRVPGRGQERQPARGDDSCRTTPSTSWAGTATTIPGPSASTTSSPASAGSTCPRRCTRRSRATGSCSAPSARGPTTSSPTRSSAPYSHQNVMSDEVLFYANAEFMSRKGIEIGLDHPAPRRPAARPAAGQDRGSRSAPRARASSRSWSTPSGPSS